MAAGEAKEAQEAKGECEETKFWLELGNDEGFISEDRCKDLVSEYSKLGMMFFRLWKEWRKL